MEKFLRSPTFTLILGVGLIAKPMPGWWSVLSLLLGVWYLVQFVQWVKTNDRD